MSTRNFVTKRHKLPDLLLGPLPVALINRTIGTELVEGEVILTSQKHDHVIKRHEHDYSACLPHIAAIIADPMYIGDDFDNFGIEMIGRVHVADSFVLVAIEIEPDDRGRYRIATFYMVSDQKVQSRRQKGFVKVAVKA